MDVNPVSRIDTNGGATLAMLVKNDIACPLPNGGVIPILCSGMPDPEALEFQALQTVVCKTPSIGEHCHWMHPMDRVNMALGLLPLSFKHLQ